MQSNLKSVHPATQRKIIAIWSPHPFPGFFQYQNLLQQFLQNYPQLICVEARFGHSEQTDIFLRQADLILLLLDQSKDFMKGISLQLIVYHAKCFPVICNYYRYCEPLASDLVRRFRLCSAHPCVIPERVLHRRPKKNLCARERRGIYADSVSEKPLKPDPDPDSYDNTIFRLQQRVESLLFS